MIRSFLINFFGFNRQQRNGLFALLAAIFVLFVARLALPYFIKPDKIEIKNIPLARVADDSSFHRVSGANARHSTNTALFKFDPNTISEAQLRQLGFSEKQAASFIRYRSKGFVFKSREDLKKVFVVSDKMYDKLEAYVSIKPTQPEIKPSGSEDKKTASVPADVSTQTAKLELNSADSMALLGLPGIGPAYAKRILKYRSLLGGFTHSEQLSEVYGFPPDLHEKLKDKVRVESSAVKKIDLNKDDFKTITRHPYIGYERTKTIFDFRKKNPITQSNLPELFPDETARTKVLPYLILGQ